MTKTEKARRRRIMAEIDQQSDCSGHNYQMGGTHTSLSALQRMENVIRDGAAVHLSESVAKTNHGGKS